MKEWIEAPVEINGVQLTTGQVIALRGAVYFFLEHISEHDEWLGDGPIGDDYRNRVSEILKMITQKPFLRRL